MMTKTLNCERFTNKAIEAIIDICNRMGWNNDTDGNGLCLIINVPIADTHLWDFIFGEIE